MEENIDLAHHRWPDTHNGEASYGASWFAAIERMRMLKSTRATQKV